MVKLAGVAYETASKLGAAEYDIARRLLMQTPGYAAAEHAKLDAMLRGPNGENVVGSGFVNPNAAPLPPKQLRLAMKACIGGAIGLNVGK